MRWSFLTWILIYELLSHCALAQDQSTSIQGPQESSADLLANRSSSEPMVLSGAVSLHFEIPELGLTYRRILEHARDLGLTHVALVAQGTMSHVQSSRVELTPPHATPLATLREVARLAKRMGLHVIIFPVLWIEERQSGEWRGVLNPQNPDLWWRSYETWLSELALIAQECEASHLSIGSELSSLESDEGRWRSLIRRIKVIFGGSLIYSANWDHYHMVGFWDALDMIGITGYYPLATHEKSASVSSMVNRWRWVRLMITEWLDTLEIPRPLIITELGYPSQKGGAMRPWHYTQSREVDLEIQRQAFSAFRQAWTDVPQLRGVNLWNLWGLGGNQDTWYTLRGKAAVHEVMTLIKTFKSRSKPPIAAP